MDASCFPHSIAAVVFNHLNEVDPKLAEEYLKKTKLELLLKEFPSEPHNISLGKAASKLSDKRKRHADSSSEPRSKKPNEEESSSPEDSSDKDPRQQQSQTEFVGNQGSPSYSDDDQSAPASATSTNKELSSVNDADVDSWSSSEDEEERILKLPPHMSASQISNNEKSGARKYGRENNKVIPSFRKQLPINANSYGKDGFGNQSFTTGIDPSPGVRVLGSVNGEESVKRPDRVSVKCLRCNKSSHCLEDCTEPWSEMPFSKEEIELTCFNCFKTGHFARDCHEKKPEHLVKKNKVNGRQLKLANSVWPNTKSTKCFKCNKAGHLAKDCPEVKCFNCNRNGHQIRNCPQPKTKNSVDSNTNGVICFNCKRTGHQAKRCPQQKSKNSVNLNTNGVTCFKCNGTGHLARDCHSVISGRNSSSREHGGSSRNSSFNNDQSLNEKRNKVNERNVLSFGKEKEEKSLKIELKIPSNSFGAQEGSHQLMGEKASQLLQLMKENDSSGGNEPGANQCKIS